MEVAPLKLAVFFLFRLPGGGTSMWVVSEGRDTAGEGVADDGCAGSLISSTELQLQKRWLQRFLFPKGGGVVRITHFT